MDQKDFYPSLDIVEFSDSAESEGRKLARLFEQHSHRYLLLEAREFDSFESLMSHLARMVVARNAGARESKEPLYAPELHISCHGSSKGISWRDRSFISWRRLRIELLMYSIKIGLVWGPNRNGPFEQTTSSLSLALSCCHGSHAAHEFFRKEPFPVGGFMAPNKMIYDEDCADFFLQLYELQKAEGPWNIPEKVTRLLSKTQPLGPEGEVCIECFRPNLTPNPNYRPPSKRIDSQLA